MSTGSCREVETTVFLLYQTEMYWQSLAARFHLFLVDLEIPDSSKRPVCFSPACRF